MFSFKNTWLVCLSLLILTKYSQARRFDASNGKNNVTIIPYQPKDCLFIISTPGQYKYTSTTTDETVCGLYLLTSAENLVEITFTEFDVPCDSGKSVGSLVQYIDGWELNRQIFPSIESIENGADKEEEYCSDNKPNKTLVTSQNGALISFRIPQVGKGFTISINFKKHPSPCNVIFFNEPFVILQNHGQRINCSLWAPTPVSFKINSYKIGNSQTAENSNKCSSSPDRIEIGGGNGLDTNQIEVLEAICTDSHPSSNKEEVISCTSSTIKLVSNGKQDNFVNITVNTVPVDKVSHNNPKYRCSSPLE